MQNSHYTNISQMEAHFSAEPNTPILLLYKNLKEYAGMAISLNIVCKKKHKNYNLHIEWMCLGLDMYGDTLQESYSYVFGSLENLLAYVSENYGVFLHNIPLKYAFDNSVFPNPIKDAGKKQEFEEAWVRFQKDFEDGRFLDSNLILSKL